MFSGHTSILKIDSYISFHDFYLFIPVVRWVLLFCVSVGFDQSSTVQEIPLTPWIDPWLSQLAACSSLFWCCQSCRHRTGLTQSHTTAPDIILARESLERLTSRTIIKQNLFSAGQEIVTKCRALPDSSGIKISWHVTGWVPIYRPQTSPSAIARSPILAILELRDIFPAETPTSSGSVIETDAVPSRHVPKAPHDKFGTEPTRLANCQQAEVGRTTDLVFFNILEHLNHIIDTNSWKYFVDSTLCNKYITLFHWNTVLFFTIHCCHFLTS